MQDPGPDQMPRKPARAAGVGQFFAAARYSSSGARRLWRESAFRQEVLFALVVLVLFVLKSATAPSFLGFSVLALVVFATEALNTALEEVIDHISPDWAEFARHAKDLGSFAVMCQLVAAGLFAAYVLVS